MKNQRSFIVALSLSVISVLSGCDHDVTTGTIVNSDGSLERLVTLKEIDSAKFRNNLMGISESGGWEVLRTPVKPEDSGDEGSKFDATFRKTFATADDANRDMDGNADTLFHILSVHEEENGFFYSSIRYQDTYRALNRFHAIPVEDYFTKEDFDFIGRLPAEGKPISRADSLYLTRLNEKIYDLYAARTIFEELYRHLVEATKEYNLDPCWLDSLARHKGATYQKFFQDGNLEGEELWKVAERLNIPIPPAARELIERKAKEVQRRMEFISTASSGKYLHTIRMPWTVVESNADSVNGNELFWRPPVVKFLLADYTMTAKSRKLNTWAVVVSGVVVVLTIGLFFVRKRRVTPS